jgi:hypothetical protein
MLRRRRVALAVHYLPAGDTIACEALPTVLALHGVSAAEPAAVLTPMALRRRGFVEPPVGDITPNPLVRRQEICDALLEFLRAFDPSRKYEVSQRQCGSRAKSSAVDTFCAPKTVLWGPKLTPI